MTVFKNRAALAYMAAGAALTLTAAAAMEQVRAQGENAPAASVPGQDSFQGGPGQPPFPGGPGQPPFQGGPGGGRPFGGPPMGGMMGGGPGAAITATDKYVYVLRGNWLYQFTADGLKQTAKAELPRPEPPRPPRQDQ